MTREEKIEKLISELVIGDKPENVSNPFSGAVYENLEPVAVALHDFIKGAEATMATSGPTPYLVEYFDLAMEHFRSQWPEAYQVLLD
jgi:hypothetical protein